MPSDRNLLVQFGLRRCRAALVLMLGALLGCSDSATPRIIGGGATSIEPLVNTWQPGAGLTEAPRPESRRAITGSADQSRLAIGTERHDGDSRRVPRQSPAGTLAVQEYGPWARRRVRGGDSAKRQPGRRR